jgi:(p)ppGpp synthase/HD superfamily hydrolase
VVSFVYTPLVRRLPTSQYSLTSFEVSYHDGQGVLRDVLSATTDLGYVVSNLEVTRLEEQHDVVAVSMDVEGKRRPQELVEALQRVGGVMDVRSSEPNE